MNVIHSNRDFVLIKENIYNIIEDYNHKLPDALSAESLHNLTTHLAITIIRLQSKNYIPLSNSQVASILDNSVLAHAKEICTEMENQFHINFPQGEVAVVSMYLSKSHCLDVDMQSGFDLIDPDVLFILKEAMETIYQTLSYDFRLLDSVYVAIGLHLSPALERLKNDQMLENPLTNHIKENHPLEYTFATVINEAISHQYQKSLTDDETAFIAIHFVAALQELNNKEN